MSARGQTEEEAALNVREWIREADYALEVTAEQSERKEKLEQARVDMFECEHAHSPCRPMCCMCVYIWLFVGLCVYAVSRIMNV